MQTIFVCTQGAIFNPPSVVSHRTHNALTSDKFLDGQENSHLTCILSQISFPIMKTYCSKTFTSMRARGDYKQIFWNGIKCTECFLRVSHAIHALGTQARFGLPSNNFVITVLFWVARMGVPHLNWQGLWIWIQQKHKTKIWRNGHYEEHLQETDFVTWT